MMRDFLIKERKGSEIVQLHCHSEHSLRDGMIRVPQLVDKVGSLGMTAIALTEHGHLTSAFSFYKACKEEGIKPIIGCEAYVVWDINNKQRVRKEATFHSPCKE